jgi:hypothetical protein
MLPMTLTLGGTRLNRIPDTGTLRFSTLLIHLSKPLTGCCQHLGPQRGLNSQEAPDDSRTLWRASRSQYQTLQISGKSWILLLQHRRSRNNHKPRLEGQLPLADSGHALTKHPDSDSESEVSAPLGKPQFPHGSTDRSTGQLGSLSPQNGPYVVRLSLQGRNTSGRGAPDATSPCWRIGRC